jgi:hypothetical protein
MAAFQAKSLGRVGHVIVIALQFGEQCFAFEGFYALAECAGRKSAEACSSYV